MCIYCICELAWATRTALRFQCVLFVSTSAIRDKSDFNNLMVALCAFPFIRLRNGKSERLHRASPILLRAIIKRRGESFGHAPTHWNDVNLRRGRGWILAHGRIALFYAGDEMRHRTLNGVCVYQRDKQVLRVIITSFNFERLPLTRVHILCEIFFDCFGGHRRSKMRTSGYQSIVKAIHAELGPVVHL